MKIQYLSKTNTSQSSLLSLCAYFGVLFGLFFVSDFVLASGGGQSLGDVAKNITGTMTNVGKLITAASYVAGVGFALMGMLKFKAHKDNPQQVPLSQPIVLIMIAAGLVFLPSLISTAGQTVFGGSQKSADTQGGGIEEMK